VYLKCECAEGLLVLKDALSRDLLYLFYLISMYCCSCVHCGVGDSVGVFVVVLVWCWHTSTPMKIQESKLRKMRQMAQTLINKGTVRRVRSQGKVGKCRGKGRESGHVIGIQLVRIIQV
jgi:hypothetical protein